MRPRWQRGVKIAAIGILAIGLFGFVTMEMWNWLVPAVFGGRTIDYWQALGILILSKILFGGFHGGPGRGRHWRHRMRERLAQMTPEERETFLRGLGGGPEGSLPDHA